MVLSDEQYSLECPKGIERLRQDPLYQSLRKRADSPLGWLQAV
jgi:hypothetical protein